MNERLLEIIQYRTRGRQKDFAELMGWVPQYLTKLLKGDNFGLTPVVKIVTALPEIDARWFLTGEGQMLSSEKQADVRRELHSRVSEFLEYEKYLPVMTASELSVFESLLSGETAQLSPETVAEWRGRLSERDAELAERFSQATEQSDSLCRQMTAPQS